MKKYDTLKALELVFLAVTLIAIVAIITCEIFISLKNCNSMPTKGETLVLEISMITAMISLGISIFLDKITSMLHEKEAKAQEIIERTNALKKKEMEEYKAYRFMTNYEKLREGIGK